MVTSTTHSILQKLVNKIFTNGIFGQNSRLGQNSKVHLSLKVSSSAQIEGAWLMAVALC